MDGRYVSIELIQKGKITSMMTKACKVAKQKGKTSKIVNLLVMKSLNYLPPSLICYFYSVNTIH
jgi:hypothetical protein